MVGGVDLLVDSESGRELLSCMELDVVGVFSPIVSGIELQSTSTVDSEGVSGMATLSCESELVGDIDLDTVGVVEVSFSTEIGFWDKMRDE